MSPIWKVRLVHGMIVLVIASAVGVIAWSGFFLALQHRPSLYQPKELTPEEQRAAEDAALAKYADLYNGVNLGESFTVTFEERLLNELLLHENTTRFLKKVMNGQEMLRQPQVAFKSGRIHLMGQLVYKNMELVVTLRLQPSLTAEGKLHLRLLPIQVGTISIPESLVRDKLQRLVEKLDSAFQQRIRALSGSDESGQKLAAQLLPALKALLQNGQADLEPVFPATPEGGQARIISMSFEKGLAALKLAPTTASSGGR